MKRIIALLLLLAGAFAVTECSWCDSAWGDSCWSGDIGDFMVYGCSDSPRSADTACLDQAGVDKSDALDACYNSQAYQTCQDTGMENCVEYDACTQAAQDGSHAAEQKCEDDFVAACRLEKKAFCNDELSKCRVGCITGECQDMAQCANICMDEFNLDCSGAVVEYTTDDQHLARCGCMCGVDYKEVTGLNVAVNCNSVKRVFTAAKPPDEQPPEEEEQPVAEEICGNGADDDFNGLVDCFDWQQCECSEALKVTVRYEDDGALHPVSGAEVNATWDDGSGKPPTVAAKTDSAGEATLELPGIWQGDGSFSAYAFFKDTVFEFYLQSGGNPQYYAWGGDYTAVKEGVAVDLKPTSDEGKTVARLWERLHEVYDYYKGTLGAKVDYQLPEQVYLGEADAGGSHSMSGVNYPLTTDYGLSFGMNVFNRGFSSTASPQNCEWHEFNHHAMMAIYGGLWNTMRLANHEGWGNTNSDDSYIEGFAEFMSLVESKSFASKYPRLAITPSVYYYAGTSKNLEQNINIQKDEEFALAGILWDLYDGTSKADKDHVQVSWQTMWGVLSTQHSFSGGTRFIQNTRDLYEAFAALKDDQLTKTYDDANNASETWMDFAGALEKVFISHGAYFDTNQNGEWDIGEPVGNTPMRGTPTAKRTDKDLPPGSYIKANVKDTDGNTITSGTTVVSVRYDPPYDYLNYDYEGDLIDGMIPVAPPYDAPVTYDIKVKADTGPPSEAITLTSAEYAAAYDANKQFFTEKQFTVIRGIPDMAACNSDGICQTGEGSTCADCIAQATDDGGILVLLGGLGLLAVVGVIGVVAVIAVAAFFLLRKKPEPAKAKRK